MTHLQSCITLYQNEQKDIALKIRELEDRETASKDKDTNARFFAETVAKYAGATEVTREMLLDLVEKIVAHEATGTRGSKRHQKVDVYFRFIGRLPDIFFQN